MSRKAIISNRIILDNVTKDEMEIYASILTYNIVTRAGTNVYKEVINNFSRISSTVCSIPCGRVDLIPADYKIIDKRICTKVEFPGLKIQLLPYQQLIFDEFNDSGLLNAPVAWGKTITALAIAKKLSMKTLIVTHTVMLRDQWVEEVEKVFGIKASVIGSGKFEYDSLITVANIQSLTKRADELSNEFGTVILDEAHHVPASTFFSIFNVLKSRYKIGLSGTLIRKDKKHVIFQDFFGFEVHKPTKENYIIPQVVIVNTDIVLKPSKHWANRVTDLELYNEEYRHLVVSLAENAASKGYKVLVVSSRVEFLKWASSVTKNSICIVGGNSGGPDYGARKELLDSMSEENNVLYGTMSIFSEGISQNSLSCLILATPINNESLLTQLIGRIVRKQDGKKQPVIIDINLKGATAVNQNKARLGHYIKEGYTIKLLNKSVEN